MKAEWKRALEDMEHFLRAFEIMPAKEFMSRLAYPLGEDEVWAIIRHAEKIGMIEPVDMLVKVEPIRQEWRLVEGFDRSKLELEAPA